MSNQEKLPRITDGEEERSTADVPRRRYDAPRLVTIMSAASLIEILGPAQAQYGGAG